MDFNELMDKMEHDIEHFKGLDINMDKLERLNKMQTLCREISERDDGIKNRFKPFTTKDKNASVALDIENPLWTFDKEIVKRMETLFSMADGVAVAIVDGTATIRMTFDVLDMWDKSTFDDA